ncbi:4-hydroxybenzoate polyprenyltransferase, mitochondrial [Trichoplusia ni]|uniref:4-hydroxybenzoate polyprenyltransferase, mitochondrial n=1 Tax=Trichoplusia ni TaxID=7111 RepID=A0A7E5X552_TRINI|nr:4-hydroxybenzoate polyprenyltransferase, mitochondrial [Trichoplusia ni]
MLNKTLKIYKIPQYTSLLQRTIELNANLKTLSHIRPYSCLCGQVYIRKSINVSRDHSTRNDHRQKAVIETTTPKIVYEKLQELPNSSQIPTIENFWRDKVDPYVKLARWDKPIGIYLLYWPCAWSIALASIPGTVPLQSSLQTAALFLVGAGLMRGAGCTINDLWDRDVDAKVERTKTRPLVTGAVSETQAVIFLAAQLSLALGILLQLNCYSILLGASSMFLVVTYPLAKRFTNYPQVVLGATFNWGALLGYSAIQGSVDWAVCGPLYVGALAWTVLYDTIYAHQDKADDIIAGVKSTALTFGPHTRPALTACLALSAGGLAAAGLAAGVQTPYMLAVAGYLAHAGRQIYTLDTENPEDCASKFRSNSSVGAIIFMGIIAGGYTQYLENLDKNANQEDTTKSCLVSYLE